MNSKGWPEQRRVHKVSGRLICWMKHYTIITTEMYFLIHLDITTNVFQKGYLKVSRNGGEGGGEGDLGQV